MLSGIGPLDELHKAGIPVKHHLPGVGSHLVDHPVVNLAYKDKHNKSLKFMNPHGLIDIFKLIGSAVQYFATRRGPLSSNAGFLYHSYIFLLTFSFSLAKLLLFVGQMTQCSSPARSMPSSEIVLPVPTAPTLR